MCLARTNQIFERCLQYWSACREYDRSWRRRDPSAGHREWKSWRSEQTHGHLRSFAVQEEIARAITTSLRMPLGLNAGENLVNNRSIDSESYEQFLRAKALLQQGGFRNSAQASTLLEQVVARNPGFAPAWALLGGSYFTSLLGAAERGPLEESRRTQDTFLPKSEMAIRRAIQLDANLANAYALLGALQMGGGHLVTAEETVVKALSLDANDPNALDSYSLLLARAGRIKDALPMREKLRSLEPLLPQLNVATATLLWLNGQNEAALAIFNTVPPQTGSRVAGTARIYASMGRYQEAADTILQLGGNIPPASAVQEAARLLRSAPAAMPPTTNYPNLDRMAWAYLYVGAPQEALQLQERMVGLGFLLFVEGYDFWHPDYAPMRKTERFKAFARKAGLVEYWRAKGWPNQCRPTTGDDFACE